MVVMNFAVVSTCVCGTYSAQSPWADTACRLGGFADFLGVQVHNAVTRCPGTAGQNIQISQINDERQVDQNQKMPCSSRTEVEVHFCTEINWLVALPLIT